MSDFSRKVTNVGDLHVVSLEGELDMATAEGLFDWLIEVSGSKVVIDFSGLTFMDSSGIAVMVHARNALGDDLVLTRPQLNVRRLFEVTGLSGWLTEWDPAWAPESSETFSESAQSQQ